VTDKLQADIMHMISQYAPRKVKIYDVGLLAICYNETTFSINVSH